MIYLFIGFLIGWIGRSYSVNLIDKERIIYDYINTTNKFNRDNF